MVYHTPSDFSEFFVYKLHAKLVIKVKISADISKFDQDINV